jgi:hypothetical protein
MGTEDAPHVVLELRHPEDISAGFEYLKSQGLAC